MAGRNELNLLAVRSPSDGDRLKLSTISARKGERCEYQKGEENQRPAHNFSSRPHYSPPVETGPTAPISEAIPHFSPGVLARNGVRVKERRKKELLKRLDRGGLVVLHVEHRVKLGDLQQVVYFFRQVQKF